MNGDGRPDRVIGCGQKYDDGSALGYGFDVRLNTGEGFGAALPWDTPPGQWAENPLFGIDSADVSYPVGSSLTMMLTSMMVANPADVNGDGLTDHQTMKAAFINTGSGFTEGLRSAVYSTPVYFARPSAVDSAIPGPQASTDSNLIDVNGDGLPDWIEDRVCLEGTPGWVGFNLGLVPQDPDDPAYGDWDSVAWQRYGFPGHLNRELADCPGNTGAELWSFLFPQRHWLESGVLTLGALMDLNGDGVQDYVLSHPNNLGLVVYFGLGDGRFLLTGPEMSPGVGRPGGVFWPIHPGATAFGPTITAPLNYAIHWGSWGDQQAKTMDIDGDGLPDHVIGLGEVWLHPGPDSLLETVTNELGGVTRIEYTPSTHLAFAPGSDFEGFASHWDGQGPGERGEALPAELVPDPRPRWVVTRVEVSDGRPNAPQANPLEPDESQELTYAAFRFDLARRESFGARAAESADAEGIATRSAFHQAPELRGRPQYSQVCDAAACYRSEETEWQIFTLVDAPSQPAEAWLARPQRTVARLCDAGAELCDEAEVNSQASVVERVFEFDAGAGRTTGNLLQETDCGIDGVCGGSYDADDRIRTLAYAQNLDEWMVSQLMDESVYFGFVDPANLVSRTRMHVDAAGYQPLAATTPVRCTGGSGPCGGLVRFRETLREQDPGGDVFAVEAWSYDGFGNMTSYKNPVAFDTGGAVTQTVAYDTAKYNTFPLSLTNALGPPHTSEFRFDAGLGEVTKALAPNGYLQCWSHDEFGRLESRSDAGSEPEDAVTDIEQGACTEPPLASFAFNGLGDPSAQHILETRETGIGPAIRSLRFFDGLGREYETASESHAGSFDVVTRAWGSRGELACETLPYRSTAAPGSWTPSSCGSVLPRRTTTHDSLLRPTGVTLVSSSGPLPEVAIQYGVNAFGGGQSPLLGDLLVEERTTIAGSGTPDRVQYVGRNQRGEVVFVREGTDPYQTTLLLRDPKGLSGSDSCW